MKKQGWPKGVLFAEIHRARVDTLSRYYQSASVESLFGINPELDGLREIITEIPDRDEVFAMDYAELSSLLARLALISIRHFGVVAWQR